MSSIITKRIGRLLLIGLNRPDKANSINREAAAKLHDIMTNEFESNQAVLGGVIYGEGLDFCTGLDLDQLSCSDLISANNASYIPPMGITHMHFTKPLVAAITGRAIGGGLELALACDLRVAEEDSTLGLHHRKYCLPMLDMGAARLPALIGLSRALDLTLTGRCLSANEALQFGLVNRVAKVGTAVGIAVQLVDTMCNLPGQEALLADRESVYRHSGFMSDAACADSAYRALISETPARLKILEYENEKKRRT